MTKEIIAPRILNELAGEVLHGPEDEPEDVEGTQQPEVPKRRYSAPRVHVALAMLGCPQEIVDSTVEAMGGLDMLKEEEGEEG